MAGRLPGVGLSPRKRSENHHNRHEHYVTYRDSSYLRESLETPWTSMTTTLDESAFKAKQRLQKKLGYSPRYLFPSSFPISTSKTSTKKKRLDKN
jgi:hypothetical protein